MTHSEEVLNMKERQQIQYEVNQWIVEEELPTRANLVVIRTDDPNFGMSEDEFQEWHEFIHWGLMQDFVLLMTIPKQDPEPDFFIPECDVTDPQYSAFNSVDFQRNLRPFDKYGYAMKKIMGRVKDLAILHSSISQPEGKMNTYNRYEAFVGLQFRDRLQALADRYHRTTDPETRYLLQGKIAELNRRILACKKIWERYAPAENWDC